MGRKYTVEGMQQVVASGTETMLVIETGSNVITKLRGFSIGQDTHETAEMYTVEVKRATDNGSGGATPTPQRMESGDAAFSGTIQANPTVEPTYASEEPFFMQPWNSVLGLTKIWREDEMPTMSPGVASGARIGIRVQLKAGMTTTTPKVTAEFEEVG